MEAGCEGKVIRRGDLVAPRTNPTAYGLVTRVARDGSWADVQWPHCTKRMKTECLVKPKEVPIPVLSSEFFDVRLLQWES